MEEIINGQLRYIHILDAEARLRREMDLLVLEQGWMPREQLEEKGHHALWMPEYGLIARWLANSQGLGLWISGDIGVGKTLLATQAIPRLIRQQYNIIMSSYSIPELNADWQRATRICHIVIDDVAEPVFVNDYGNRHLMFSEVVNQAYNCHHLLIFTTNLTESQLSNLYGRHITDRLRQMCRHVVINGKSLRGKEKELLSSTIRV